jgi:hypothetical protein
MEAEINEKAEPELGAQARVSRGDGDLETGETR